MMLNNGGAGIVYHGTYKLHHKAQYFSQGQRPRSRSQVVVARIDTRAHRGSHALSLRAGPRRTRHPISLWDDPPEWTSKGYKFQEHCGRHSCPLAEDLSAKRNRDFLSRSLGLEIRVMVVVSSPHRTQSTREGSISDIPSTPSAPGLKFGYSGAQVAITFGPLTSPGVLVGYRISGLDWQFTNVTGGRTHMLVGAGFPGGDLAGPINRLSPYPFFSVLQSYGNELHTKGCELTFFTLTATTFEMRVTNWAYGVQIEAIHVGSGQKLIKLPDARRRIEVIGDSLAAGSECPIGAVFVFPFCPLSAVSGVL